MAHIIVVGNEKGGAGKSTVSMHVATALARMGHDIAVLDLDLRQRSLGRYIENRRDFMANGGPALPTPTLIDAPQIDDAALPPLVGSLAHHDFVLIDCPGSHNALSEQAHSLADTLVTPLNDSFVDFDLLARIDGDGEKIKGPSVYAEMVWKARQMRAREGREAIDWIVVRNRLGAQNMVNKKRVETALALLSRRIGFRTAPGFGERVVFRELFPKGLTLLDLRDTGIRQLNMSNIAARQEVRDLLKALDLPGVQVKV